MKWSVGTCYPGVMILDKNSLISTTTIANYLGGAIALGREVK